MTFPIRKSARKLTGIVKITISEVFPEMKPLGNVIIFPMLCSPGSRGEREGQGGQGPLPIHTHACMHACKYACTHTHSAYICDTQTQTCYPASNCCIPTAQLLIILSLSRELYIILSTHGLDS